MAHDDAITLVLMRHGVAEDPDARETDEARELTPEGLVAADAAARGLVALGVQPDVVVSSPLIRCRQTAGLVADAAGCPLEDDARLAPGMTADDLLQIVIEHPDARTIVCCSHQPGLTYALDALTNCGDVAFGRPQAAVVTLHSPRVGGGTLTAVLPPTMLRRAGPQ
jgi:phosphohistidine phosphatase